MTMHWLSHLLGLDNGSSPFYLWHSGFGSNLGLYAGLFIALRHLNCHKQGCARLAKHPYKHYKFCKKHHPVEGRK